MAEMTFDGTFSDLKLKVVKDSGEKVSAQEIEAKAAEISQELLKMG